MIACENGYFNSHKDANICETLLINFDFKRRLNCNIFRDSAPKTLFC